MPRRRTQRRTGKDGSQVKVRPDLVAGLERVESAAGQFAAAGHSIRLGALYLLTTRDSMTVGDLYAALGSETSTISSHLARLRIAGLITMRKHSAHRFYRLTDHPFNRFLRNSIWSPISSSP